MLNVKIGLTIVTLNLEGLSPNLGIAPSLRHATVQIKYCVKIINCINITLQIGSANRKKIDR